jgi:hypothetical protein
MALKCKSASCHPVAEERGVGGDTLPSAKRRSNFRGNPVLKYVGAELHNFDPNRTSADLRVGFENNSAERSGEELVLAKIRFGKDMQLE